MAHHPYFVKAVLGDRIEDRDSRPPPGQPYNGHHYQYGEEVVATMLVERRSRRVSDQLVRQCCGLSAGPPGRAKRRAGFTP